MQYSIGVLLPRSIFYPSISFDIFDGLRSGLKYFGQGDIRLVSSNIGFGAEKQECYRAAEKLILEENVSIVFAYIGHHTAQLLRPLFMSANKMLVVLDAGCNMPQEWPTSPNIFYHSLHNSLGIWLSASVAAKNGHKEAGTASCFYDGGYLHTYAMAKGWQNAGGNIVFNHATGYKEEEFSMTPLVKYFEEYPQGCLLAIFSMDFAQWFYRDIKVCLESKETSIYVAPYALEEVMLSRVPYPNGNVKGVVPWSKNLKNEENKIFIETLKQQGKEANIFSLLAWEAACIAIKYLQLLESSNNDVLQASARLQTFTFIGPRGKCQFNKEYNYSITPLFEVVLKDNAQGGSALGMVREIKIEETEQAFKAMASINLDNATSGWYNSYTCI